MDEFVDERIDHGLFAEFHFVLSADDDASEEYLEVFGHGDTDELGVVVVGEEGVKPGENVGEGQAVGLQEGGQVAV